MYCSTYLFVSVLSCKITQFLYINACQVLKSAAEPHSLCLCRCDFNKGMDTYAQFDCTYLGKALITHEQSASLRLIGSLDSQDILEHMRFTTEITTCFLNYSMTECHVNNRSQNLFTYDCCDRPKNNLGNSHGENKDTRLDTTSCLSHRTIYLK